MTQYMVYQLTIERLERLGAQTKDARLLTFYSNAIKGFKAKQLKLTLAQANGFIIG